MDASAVVSETDAAHSSEDEDHDWLSASVAPPQQASLPRIDEQIDAQYENNQQLEEGTDDDEIDETVDELYCANMDDEDEAWVYKNLRGGEEEPVYVRMLQTGNNQSSKQNVTMKDGDTVDESSGFDEKKHSKSPQDQSANFPTEQMQKALLLKPRNSDAVLSCPRCFTTVCMDCQQHSKYANQYRAMFVMNIGVDWNKRMVWDESVGGLKLFVSPPARTEIQREPDTIPYDAGHGSEEVYYSVHCGYCQFEVAALDMSDEIYYFYGCIASG